MNVAVFCSSSNRIESKFKTIAYQLGEWIAENGHVLVYGGATGGLMDSVADGAHSKGGKIIGVVAKAIVRMKRTTGLPVELRTTASLSERKDTMRNLADIFVVLPGSYGTFDEMFDVVSSGIVGEHNKKLYLLNQDGFYNLLLSQVNYCRAHNFLPTDEKYMPIVVNDIKQFFELNKQS